MHYDVMSAFQKSIRGSDVNAALHYLARLIEAGDLPTIVRRLLVISYEDIGLASPNAGQRTLAAIESAERLGLPEARIPLSQAVIELCLSPKSNSAMSAIDSALSDIRNGHVGQIPNHLKDGHYQGAKDLGRSIGYKYPHQYVNGYVSQQYLPDKLKNKIYYEPKRHLKVNNNSKKYITIYLNKGHKNKIKSITFDILAIIKTKLTSTRGIFYYACELVSFSFMVWLHLPYVENYDFQF